jgi:AraC-like DNA-binding protein
MLANLQEPISLSDIESQRYGCGPTQWLRRQWLRRQRLERAMTILGQPRPGLTVSQLAQDCGDLSQAAFSRDILQRFGHRPSELIRQQRRRF